MIFDLQQKLYTHKTLKITVNKVIIDKNHEYKWLS